MNKTISKFAAAIIIYIGFAVYLYQPYFKNFNRLQYLIVVNTCLASMGCFLLSCRWIPAFAGSLFAGAIYGFGPFVLGLAKFHPTAGLLTAIIPWLFCPAAYGPKNKWRWLSWPLSTLPFLAIMLFFQLATYFRLFAIPIQTKLISADLAGLFAPLVIAEQNTILVGFYHIPIAPLVIGFSMLLAARRYGIITIFGVGTVLAFSSPIFNISPCIWLTFPCLCCSVLVGAGMQGLASAGPADRKWVLATAIIMGIFSFMALLLSTKQGGMLGSLGTVSEKLLVETAKIYLLGTITVAILYFMARVGLRLRLLRLILLCSAIGIDIFLCTRFIVDRTF